MILITDPEHAVPVRVERTGLRTIAVGAGDTASLALPYLPANADVKDGDLLVTSGLGGVFPEGYPVARVTEVHRDAVQPLAQSARRPAGAHRYRYRARAGVVPRGSPRGAEEPVAVSAKPDAVGELKGGSAAIRRRRSRMRRRPPRPPRARRWPRRPRARPAAADPVPVPAQGPQP